MVDSIMYGFFVNLYKDIVNNIMEKLSDCLCYMSYILCFLYVLRCKEGLVELWLLC